MAIKLLFQPVGRDLSSSIKSNINDALCADCFAIEARGRSSATLDWGSEGDDIEVTNVRLNSRLTLALRFLHAWHAADIRTDLFVLGSLVDG